LLRSCGGYHVHTRAVLLLAVLALALCVLPVRSQVTYTLAPPIGLGFGPANTTPIANGVPIYTTGDQLWVTSTSQSVQNVNLTNPSGSLAGQAALEPFETVLFYSFTSADQAGYWTLKTSSPAVPQNVWTTQVLLVGAETTSINMSSYQLSSSGNLTMSFVVSSPTAYDIGACLTGSDRPDLVTIPIPANLGTGNLVVGTNESGISLTREGLISSPFTFWIELHQDYSYILGTPSTIVSRDLLAAESASVPVPAGSWNATVAPLQSELQMRGGRYTLRAFFESASGLSAYETQVLLVNASSWIWLQGCAAFSNSLASSFSLSAPLTAPVSQWPRELWVMFADDGIETFSEAPLPVEPAAIELYASPWGRVFTNAHPIVVPSVSVEQYSIHGNTIYLTGRQYPLRFTVDLLGGGTNQTGTVLVPAPFYFGTLNMSSSKVVVETTRNGVALSGAAVEIRYGNGTVATLTSQGGKATFYLPPGNYTVVASSGGVDRSEGVFSRGGAEDDVTLDFGTTPNNGVSYVLMATAGVGAVASVSIWVNVLRRRSRAPA